MKRLSILGSTGSIGKSTIDVVMRFPDMFQVTALAAKKNISLLAGQIEKLSPDIAVVYEKKDALALEKMLSPAVSTRILWGEEGYRRAAAHNNADMVVSAIVGAAGMAPTLDAIRAGKDIALANKETLVMAGSIVMAEAAAKGVRILPVDSEHSAVFQCMEGHGWKDVDRILLTASGGPFREMSPAGFAGVTPEQALAHPTWNMGKKISIDSATLMNKGLEVIEAHHLFGIPADKIEVVIHPESIVHSMVAFVDGSVLAQMGRPDMRGAIAYALAYPARLAGICDPPDFAGLGGLHFERPDFNRFPCLALAYEACKAGKTFPAVLNAANEVAVSAFLAGRIRFNRIPDVIESILEKHEGSDDTDLDAVIVADGWARKEASVIVKQFADTESPGGGT